MFIPWALFEWLEINTTTTKQKIKHKLSAEMETSALRI